MAQRSTKKTSANDAVLRGLRARALARYPGAHLKSPWPGHLDLAVNDKTFAYLSIEGEPFGISCKLPHSNGMALMLPYVTPTGYGLGKSGWVTAKLPDGETPDVEMFEAWIDESYRAQAPRKLVAQLDAATGVTPSAPAAARSAPSTSRSKTSSSSSSSSKARASASPKRARSGAPPKKRAAER